MGPFFNDVAEWLESLGRNAVNVVFNGGDRFTAAIDNTGLLPNAERVSRMVTGSPPAI